MAMTGAERMRAYRRRKALGLIAEGRKHPPFTCAERMKRWRERHPHIEREKHLKLKIEVLTFYGNDKLACVVCGENRLACLSIDHIDGGGNKQRKGSLHSPTGFYRWLKRNEYPNGYQTLCMNCQFVKRFERNEHN